MKQGKSCGAIIFNDENGKRKYLLVRQVPSRNWGFAKGHVQPGETEDETALREVLEESGLSVKLLPHFRVETSYYSPKYDTRNSVVLFLGEAETLDAKPGDDVDASVWLGFDAALAKLTFNNTRQLLKRAEKFLKERKKK
jgi:8-oxo-dGTP pyrophosphatase MutT (NUDIX family)